MKFRKPVASEPTTPVELRIESVGRFGNYFFSYGWLEGFRDGSPDPGAEYAFVKNEPPTAPEYSFYGPMADDGGSSRFLHFFWINDGYKLAVGPSSPVHASVKNGSASRKRVTIRELLADDFAAFLAALESVGGQDVWANRFALEVVSMRGTALRKQFVGLALARIGWRKLSAAVEAWSAFKGGVSISDRLDFLCLCVANTEMQYLGADLRTEFLNLTESFRVSESDRELSLNVIRQLARIDNELACQFALRSIKTMKHSRKQLGATLQICFPQHSQWWMLRTMKARKLGDEQAADALNCAGTAAATQGQSSLAILSYEAALMIYPKAQSAAWNAGLYMIERGEFERAAEFFGKVSRHYTLQSLSSRWPQVRKMPWPAAPLEPKGFVLPNTETNWPRITVITPSFNQGCYIEETVLSVLNQGYPNLQYIVVDGNSTDETRDVLERYRDRFDTLIIEPDKGQTEAINKGLRLADGDLVAWINSDDIYGPGALHKAALDWLENRADVIAGICVEHVERRMLLFNKPAAGNAEFNPPQLARIFKYWLKGHYFYQPEVFFSRRILDEVGLLDESLYYSMDYDLWMRFSKAGAVLHVVDWPFAFFRKHDQQKTSNLVDCVEEQARVRSRHFTLETNEERDYEIQRSISLLKHKKGATVGVLTKRLGKIFSNSIQSELDRFANNGMSCFLSDDENDPRIAGADFVIMLVHVLNDLETIKRLRAANPERLIAGWFWDNHHHLFENFATAEAIDIVLPGHAIYGEYLRNDQTRYGGHIPLCVTQWARQDTARWFSEAGAGDRSEELYGGFVEYCFEPARTEFLRSLMEAQPKHSLSILTEANLKSYFGRSEEDRFLEWCRYRTSLILPLRNDLSQRVFDSLLAGQIPLVPEEIADLDLVIPRELQESLPIVRFRMNDVSSVIAAHQQALESFARLGPAGALARHEFALERHTFSARINSILDLVLTS